MTRIIRDGEPEARDLAGMLARAFMGDPLYAYVFPDPGVRQSGLAWDMGNLVRYGLRYGEVLATPDLAGCAIIFPPGETEFTEVRMAEFGMLDAAAHIGEEPARRLHEFEDESEEHHRRLVPCPHWYLAVLGVDPGRQAGGLGGELLSRVLHRADEDRSPVYLETLNPANLSFYGKRGFTIQAEAALPSGGIPVWYMVRPAVE